MRHAYLYLLLFPILALWGCANNATTSTLSSSQSPKSPIAKITSPKNNTQNVAGESIPLKIDFSQSVGADSIILKYGHHESIRLVDSAIPTIQFPQVGSHRIVLLTWYKGNYQSSSVQITQIPASPPEEMGYRIVNHYPHDPEAYTQGLLWHDGYLYESTGVNGHSSVRKVELKTGKVLERHDLSRQYFGEGLSLYNNQLYQLTWRNHEAFVYDLRSLEPVGKRAYATEGWGLATLNDQLVMSDGSEKLYFLNPESFAVMSTLQVYDEKGKVNMLNEMELIDGIIYANVYMRDIIVGIDPESGAVVKRIDMTGLRSVKETTGDEDVFNGIAYDAKTRRTFVTGKYWSRLYEVEFIRK